MLNRRLVALFILFVLGFCALVVRLGHLQITEAARWQEEMRAYVHRPIKIETARGAILDRNGLPLAIDTACYDLAIDYRAMNRDDRWLRDTALERLKNETFADREERLRRIEETKAAIADQIGEIPAAIAKLCDTSSLIEPDPKASPLEKVLARFAEIRQSIHILRQDVWNRPYVKGDESLDPAEQDARFHRLLKDEVSTHTIIPHISDELAFYFRAHADEFPGLRVVDSHVRLYPNGIVACHVIGSLRGVDADTLGGSTFRYPDLLSSMDAGNLKGYLPGDKLGESGMERVLEDALRGVRGCRVVVSGGGSGGAATNPADNAEEDDEARKRIEAALGKDVRLTLDIALQKDIEEGIKDPARNLLKGKDGKEHFAAAVVLSVEDRQVLSLFSSPGYDLNKVNDMRAELNSDEYRRPLSNRGLQGYQPGSTVKPLLATAVLSEGLMTPDTSVTCVGHFYPNRPHMFRCDGIHGSIQMIDALAQSCNVYFYTVGGRLGMQRLVTWYGNFGLGRDTGFELPDTDGSIPKLQGDLETDVATHDAMQLGIGQGPITVSPLQMANAYATLLRAGQLIAPRIKLEDAPKVRQGRVISPETLAIVREGMRRVAQSGTGRGQFRDMKLAVAGKTGTADTRRPAFDEAGNKVFDPSRPVKNPDGSQKLGPDGQPLFYQASDKPTDAWFVGYAPADRPKFVVAAVMENGGHGGTAAAPLVKEIFLQLERHNYLPALDVSDERVVGMANRTK